MQDTTPSGLRQAMPVLKWFWDLMGVFTQAKSFEANAVLGSRLLNRLGLHVARVVLAHAAMGLRRTLLSWRLPRDVRKQFRREGFVLVDNVLSESQWTQAQALAGHLRGMPAIETVQGNSQTRQWPLNPWHERAPPVLRALPEVVALRAALSYVAGRFRTPYFWLQQVRQEPTGATPDPQFAPHADSFQPGMKAWLYLTDVNARNGPLYYLPGSHRLSWKRLCWEYRQSLVGARLPDVYAARGSLRARPRELSDMNYDEVRSFMVKANTLVVIDTFGFHGRSPANSQAERVEFWCLSRANPFNPFPGLPFSFLNRLDLLLYARFDRVRKNLRRRQKQPESDQSLR